MDVKSKKLDNVEIDITTVLGILFSRVLVLNTKLGCSHGANFHLIDCAVQLITKFIFRLLCLSWFALISSAYGNKKS